MLDKYRIRMNANSKGIFLSAAILWLGHFLIDFMIGIWPVYKTMAHFDLAKAGIIGGLGALTGEGLQMIFGSFSDRGYRKPLIAFGLIASAMTIVLTYVDSFWWVFLLYLVSCVGSGAFHPCAVSLMGDVHPKRKGVFISLFASGGALGLGLSQIVFSFAYQGSGGNVGWMIVPSFILAGFTLYFLRGGGAPSVIHGKKIDLKVFKRFFQHPELSLLYGSQICNATILWGTMFLLPDVLYQRSYQDWVAYGGGHFLLILGGGLMMVPAGYLADRYSSRSVLLWATVISSLLFYLFLFVPEFSSEQVLFLLFLLGASIGVVNPISVALGTRLAPNHKGMVSAFLMGMVWCVSEGIGQAGGGLLTKLFLEDSAANALMVIGLLFLPNILFLSKLSRETTHEHIFQYVNP